MPEDAQIITADDGRPMLAQDLGKTLSGILGTLGRIEKCLDGKADKSDLLHIDQRVARLEGWRHDKEVAAGVHTSRDGEMFTRRQKVWGALGASSLLCATIVGPILGSIVSRH